LLSLLGRNVVAEVLENAGDWKGDGVGLEFYLLVVEDHVDALLDLL